MIFARSPEAEQKLVQMFRKHDMHRIYVAIVQGRLEAQTIETNLVRDRGDGKRGSTTLKDVGQHAITHVKPLEYLDGYTVVQCQLETGRTHQIRIHLAERGHVLCGEKTYHTPLFEKAVPDHSGAPRIALHATELGLVHPISGEKMTFKMPMPPDMAELLSRLRAKSKPQAKDAPE
jgi:23S rRNA pseudouridine1911/1915/1917 synthase